jgi:predicted RecA/RadA family phage recombinase
MTATYIHDGDIVDHIPANDLPCGAVVVLGALVGIAHRPIPAGALGSLALEGVWDLPSAGVAGTAWSPAFWNSATNLVTADGGVAGVVRCGVFTRPVAATDPTVRVLLNR